MPIISESFEKMFSGLIAIADGVNAAKIALGQSPITVPAVPEFGDNRLPVDVPMSPPGPGGGTAQFLVNSNPGPFDADFMTDYRTNYVEPSRCSWTARDFNNGNPDLTHAQLVAGGHIDSVTQMPIRIPAGYSVILSSTMIEGFMRFPEYYRALGPFVLDWTGTADMTIAGQDANMTVINANRKEWSPPLGHGDRILIQINSIDENNPPTRMRVYELSENPDSNGGWSTRATERLALYGITRMLDIVDANRSDVIHVDDVARTTDLFWGHLLAEPDLYRRDMIPFEAQLSLCVATNTGGWFHQPIFIGASSRLGDLNLDLADVISYAQAQATNIIASNQRNAYRTLFLNALDASPHRTSGNATYFEVHNELWNTAFPFLRATLMAKAIGQAINPAWTGPQTDFLAQEGHRQALGWLTAEAMHNFDVQQVARGTSHNILFPLSIHTARTETLTQALEGFDRYCSDNGLNIPVMRARLIPMGTSYWSGALSDISFATGQTRTHPILVETGHASFDALWTAVNGNATQRQAFLTAAHNWYTTANEPLTVPWLRNQFQELKTLALAAGLVWPGGLYEGGTHEDRSQLQPTITAAKLELLKTLYHSPEWVDVTRQINLGLVADHGTGFMLSNFSVGMPSQILTPFTGASPWDDGHEAEGPTLATQMWAEFAR